jgi:hypothetical protein
MNTSTFRFIMVFLVVISCTISFKGEHDETDTGVSIPKLVDAQDEQEDEDDADTTVEPKGNGNNEQEIDKEESLTREEKEEPGNEEEVGVEVQRDEVKKECASEEHFDFDVSACIPNKEKDCDDGRDDDYDDKVDSEDSDCQTNEKQMEQVDNKEGEKDIEKPAEEEKYVDNNKEDSNDGKNAPPLELESNETMTSDDYSITEGKAQNSQNLTEIHLEEPLVATISNNTNNASSGEHSNTNGSLIEPTFTLKCNPTDIIMMPGTESSIFCTAENKVPEPIELAIRCLGLDGTGVECYINGEDSPPGTISLKELSDTNFSILLASASSPPAPVGSYPFSINAECTNTDLVCQFNGFLVE